MQLTGQKLGNITDSKNSRRVNPFAAMRPRRWTEELVQNKQSKTPDLFIPLCRDVSSQPAIFIRLYAAFFSSSIGGEGGVCIAADAGSSCCAFSLLFPDGEIPVA